MMKPCCPECQFPELLAMNPKHMVDQDAIRYFCPMCGWGCSQYPEAEEGLPGWAATLGSKKHPDVPFCCSGVT